MRDAVPAPYGALRLHFSVAPPDLFVVLAGELDAFTAVQVRTPPDLDLQMVTSVHLDLELLSFCDCGGARALLEFGAEHIEAGRAVHITSASAHAVVMRVLELMGVTRLFG